MAGAICNYSPKEVKEWADTMNDIWVHWKSHKRINDRFTDPYSGYREVSSAKNMKWFIEQRLELPFDSQFVLKKDQVSRIKVEINSLANALNGKLNNFAWIVPEGTSKLDPTARRFYNQLNSILNTERVNTNTLWTRNKEIADHMFNGYIKEAQISPVRGALEKKFNFGKDAISEIKRLRQELAFGDPNDLNRANFEGAMDKFYKSDNGKQIRDLITLLEMTKKDFNDLRNKKYYDEDGSEYNFNVHTYRAAESGRKLLKEMGYVYTKALSRFRELIAWKFTNQGDVAKARSINKTVDSYIKKIDNVRELMEDAIKKEGYFPQVQLPTILTLKESLSKAMSSKSKDRNRLFEETINTLIEQVDVRDLPDHLKGRNANVAEWYEKDPLLVLSEYGNQAAGFNKMVHTQVRYLEALKHIPNNNLDFSKGVKRFIDEEYTVFVQGNATRADWVNKAVGTLAAINTVRTMGLNISGGVKNALSAVNYYAKVGYDVLGKTIHAMSHETGKNEFATRVDIAEREAGFLFTDVSKELYTEGLITKETMQQKQISFDPLSGKIKIEGENFAEYALGKGKDLLSWTIDKSLFLHRYTENKQRQWMFRTAFYQKWHELIDGGYGTNEAAKFSKNFALEMVNGWAYEYARHAKSKVSRGEGRTFDEVDNETVVGQLKGAAGGFSEFAMQLMHYPQSLQESQWSILKGAGKSIKARQLPKQLGGTSEELSYMLRFGGMALVVALGSAITNMDLFNMVDIDTANRIKQGYDSLMIPLEERAVKEGDIQNLTYDSSKATWGLLSLVSGYGANQLADLAIYSSWIDLDDNVKAQVLFGNVDLSDPEDELNKRFQAYQYSTFYGTMKNKWWPAIEAGRGRDLFTDTLKLYPSAYTKRAHEFIFGKKKDKTSRSRSKRNNAALDIIKSGYFG